MKDIIEGVANLESIPGRFERVNVRMPYDVIVDYAHTPDGLEKIITAVKAITKNRVILVFGATGDRDKEKRPIMGEIAARLADRIFLTDEESYNEDPATIRKMVYDGIERVRSGAIKTIEVPDRRFNVSTTPLRRMQVIQQNVAIILLTVSAPIIDITTR